MSRRSKQELLESNYYEWLKDKEILQKKKKEGFKLTQAEKELIRTVPTVERPYVPLNKTSETKQTKTPQRKEELKVIPWGREKEFEVKGGYFLCEVRHAPFNDVECVLFCERQDCPFYGEGYLKIKKLR